MKILVNGKQAVMKEGSSFEYHSENPLFTEAEDYSFDIEFPMKDCPENILIFGALHVKGVDISTVTYPCRIQTASFDKTGILTITEVNDAAVKGQFLEGMSTQRFAGNALDIYIDELDYTAYDGTSNDVPVTDILSGTDWVDLAVYDADKDEVDPQYNRNWTAYRHIRLRKLMQIIAEMVGVAIDLGGLDSLPMFAKVVVANTTYDVFKHDGLQDPSTGLWIYGARSFMNLEKTLPHWTIKEFYLNIAKYFGCLCRIDNQGQLIEYVPYGNFMQGNSLVELTVLDDFTVEMGDAENASFVGSKKPKLPDDCNPDNINSCPWIFALKDKLGNKMVTSELQFGYGLILPARTGEYSDITELHKLFILGDADSTKWALITEEEKNQSDNKYFRYQHAEVLNQFTGMSEDGEELAVLPCTLKAIPLRTYSKIDPSDESSGYAYYDRYARLHYRMPVLSITPNQSIIDAFLSSDNFEVLSGGEDGLEKMMHKYKNLFLVLDTGQYDVNGHNVSVRRFEMLIGNEYATSEVNSLSGKVPYYSAGIQDCVWTLSPTDASVPGVADLPKVDETQLYRYKFLASSLPSATAIYVIKGKRYACLRLTAHFTVDGMSDLIEGEFYEIIG